METGNKPRRRVGSTTLGLALVLAGVVMLLYYFWPGFDFLLAAKLSPLILVALGVEILFTSFKPEERRYDFLSVFLCLVLMGIALVVSFLPSLYNYIGPQRHALEASLSAQLEDSYYQRLKDSPVQDLAVNLYLNYASKPASTQQISAGDTLGLSIQLSGSYENAEDFAESCRAVLDQLDLQNPRVDWVDFTAPAPADVLVPDETGEESYEDMQASLYLSGPYQLAWSAQKMAGSVNFF